MFDNYKSITIFRPACSTETKIKSALERSYNILLSNAHLQNYCLLLSQAWRKLNNGINLYGGPVGSFMCKPSDDDCLTTELRALTVGLEFI